MDFLDPETLKNWAEMAQDKALGALPSIVSALAIFFVGRFVARLLVRIAGKVMRARKMDDTLIGFLTSVGYAMLMAVICISAVGKLGVDTTSFAALIAAAGLAVGMALQGSLGNFASGVMIILFRPFKAGDFVEGGGVSGVVLEVGVFATTLKTPDNKRIIVPNSGMTGGNIINYSANDTRRVDLVFGVGYDDDLKEVKEILMGLCTSHDKVLSDPEPVVAVHELADSSVNLVCRPWVETADYWDVYWDLTEAAKHAFDERGISIPYPQQDVHMRAVPQAEPAQQAA